MRESLLTELLDGRRGEGSLALRAERHFYNVSQPEEKFSMNAQPDSSGLADPRGKRVLVVDDDDDLRELVSLILTREGFSVETAVDGKEALDAAQARRPDLIVLDLMLPRFGGYEVLRRLQEGATAGVPIFVMTGRYKDLNTAAMIRAEANVVEFLEKPLDARILSAKAHAALKTRPPA